MGKTGEAADALTQHVMGRLDLLTLVPLQHLDEVTSHLSCPSKLCAWAAEMSRLGPDEHVFPGPEGGQSFRQLLWRCRW